MGECGCDLQVRRCREHADDVVLVLEREEARIAMRWILGYRPGPYPEDREWGRALDQVTRAIAHQLERSEARGSK